MRILLVDDEKDFVSTLAERLSLRGIDVDWVIRPEDALRKADEQCYDLAVLDVKMPRIDGIALKGRLKQKCPSMKFIFLTGHGSGDDYQAGVNATGVDNYLAKPLKINDLLEKIKVVTAGQGEEKDG